MTEIETIKIEPLLNREMKVAKSPSEALALTNCLIVAPNDFPAETKYVLVDGQYAFTLRRENAMQSGFVGTSALHRAWAMLSLNQDVAVTPFDPSCPPYSSQGEKTMAALPHDYLINSISLTVDFLRKGMTATQEYDTAALADVFKKNFMDQIFTVGMKLVIDFCGVNLSLTVTAIEIAPTATNAVATSLSSKQHQQQYEPQSTSTRGVLMPSSLALFLKSPESTIKLVGTAKSHVNANAILAPTFKFEDMGIGGLDEEFATIFRRAFASRIFPPSVVERMGIQHVKGILLYGPPGTGKTLIARQIGKMLNAKEPKIVNGPEILNKYVGQSEENIRNLFKDAEQDYKMYGDQSQLHIIIFDELDAICKQRGSKNDNTGVGDSVVNQLLSKLDGVEQLNNILVIGMTNRLDMIDEALLRPGRLEIKLEIGLPDENGRLQILKIHTAKMKENSILHEDVNLAELAHVAKNFSGAEICALIKSATSFAMNRHIKVGTVAAVSDDVDSMKVIRDDFMHAFDEVQAAYGMNENEFESCGINGIVNFSPHIQTILQDGSLFIEQVRNSKDAQLVTVLLHGAPGCGKTSLAAKLAQSSLFPYVKLISPENMVGFSESAKVTTVSKIFHDSYKSDLSIIVMDSIERLLEYVPIGPRFSNAVLQTLLVLLQKFPPKNRKLLIFVTTERKVVLDEMGMMDVFNADVYVPNIVTVDEIINVLKTIRTFSDTDTEAIVQSLPTILGNKRISLGIKKLIMIMQMASQAQSPKEKFLSVLLEQSDKLSFH